MCLCLLLKWVVELNRFAVGVGEWVAILETRPSCLTGKSNVFECAVAYERHGICRARTYCGIEIRTASIFDADGVPLVQHRMAKWP